MGNPLWVPGKSPNPLGRPKGSRRNARTTIARFILRNGSLKELQANYNLLLPGRERLEFLLKLMPYHITPVAANIADSLTDEEIDRFYSRLEQKLNEDAKKAS